MEKKVIQKSQGDNLDIAQNLNFKLFLHLLTFFRQHIGNLFQTQQQEINNNNKSNSIRTFLLR